MADSMAGEKTELRFDVPLELAAALDARVIYLNHLGRGHSRTSVVLDLIRAMAEDEARRARIFRRLTADTDLGRDV